MNLECGQGKLIFKRRVKKGIQLPSGHSGGVLRNKRWALVGPSRGSSRTPIIIFSKRFPEKMSDDHILKGLLQFQLASDAQAVLNAPYVLGCISSSALRPSPHLSKWLTRINTLVRAQDPGVVWAGLAFALQTAVSSKSIMIESANGWLTVALPILAVRFSLYISCSQTDIHQRKDGSPTLKAAIRLIRTILSKATDVTEFQRQVCASVVPKFSEALLSVIHNTSDVILKVSSPSAKHDRPLIMLSRSSASILSPS